VGHESWDVYMSSTQLVILLLSAASLPIARRIVAAFDGRARVLAPATTDEMPSDPSIERYDASYAQQLVRLRREGVPVLAIASVEATVRALVGDSHQAQVSAPLLAVDETGRFIIPMLSGEMGNAHNLAARVAQYLGGVAVIPPGGPVGERAALVIGVGAEKGVPAEDLEAAVCDVLQVHGLSEAQVMTVATLDRRAAEDGFRRWLAQRQWPVVTYTAAQLAQVQPIPTPSEIVARAVGTPGVCEPAAMLASGSDTLLVPKQKHGRVTVAVARKAGGREDRQRGHLAVIGIGPGAADLLTVRATNALRRAEVIVGYQRYVQLVGEHIAGKEICDSAIGHERDRARLAIALARQGRQVALISSGDAGVYGMASLAFEELDAQGWHAGQTPEVEVIPGVTAAQAAASLLGAPLANDFAVLSLSDLLKPRAVVERRLAAIAAADVVIALYNPQSQQRRQLFRRACEILLRHRPATTPVAVVRAAYRTGQAIHLDELGRLAELPVTMESLVLVGNSQTRRVDDSLLTARGYDSTPTQEGIMEADPCEASQISNETGSPPKVLFVGAGPGDPELLTLRGARALATADVVVYAGSLVPRGVLAHVRPGTRIHNSAILTLEETHRLLTDAYRGGLQVVRLHSGDPSLYGAITEQMVLLDQEQIPYDIVPGVSAFQAVAARLGFEYTQPGVVQTIILTRAGGRTGLPANESLAKLARHGVTLCIFLSARHVTEVQEALLSSYPSSTPVAVAYRATWPDEELTVGTLADLSEMVQRPGYDRTTLIIVGPSLQRHGKRSHLYDPAYQHLFRPGKRKGRKT
jgi:precorrin-4 C11-methyltransferase